MRPHWPYRLYRPYLTGSDADSDAGSGDPGLLLENGDNLLLENGDQLLLE